MYPSVEVANIALAEAGARSVGHAITIVCTWMDMNDKDVHAECNCGWRSEDVTANAHARRLGREHALECLS
jgi:hypothetical protein